MQKALTTKYIWGISVAFSLLLFITLLFLWYKEYHFYIPYKEQLDTEEKVTAYLQNTWEKTHPESKPVYIPTGIYIKSLNFLSTENIMVTGYIWQHFTSDFPNNIKRGFIFPESVDSAGSLMKEPAYQHHYDNYDIQGTYFEVKIQHDFSYKRYPFDSKIIKIYMLPMDFDKNVILTPTLKAYDNTSLSAAFGLSPNIFIDGYKIFETYFGYELSNYETDFGIPHYIGKKGFPELYFGIAIKRDILNAIIMHVLPLAVVIILLFSILLMTTEQRSKIARFDYNVNSTIATCSALFFVLILAHNELRHHISSDQISYLEYIYLMIYGFIALVAINAYILASDQEKKLTFLHYADNLIVKVLYWPCLLLSVLALTLLILQPFSA